MLYIYIEVDDFLLLSFIFTHHKNNMSQHSEIRISAQSRQIIVTEKKVQDEIKPSKKKKALRITFVSLDELLAMKYKQKQPVKLPRKCFQCEMKAMDVRQERLEWEMDKMQIQKEKEAKKATKKEIDTEKIVNL